MTVAVVFHNLMDENLIRQWEYALSHFRPDALYCVGGTEAPTGAVLSTATVIANSNEVPSASTLVLLAPTNGLYVQGDESLTTFVHPTDAVYWLGSDAHHLDPVVELPRAPDHRVYIPVDTADQMFSHAVWCVVAWDRRSKSL